MLALGLPCVGLLLGLFDCCLWGWCLSVWLMLRDLFFGLWFAVGVVLLVL